MKNFFKIYLVVLVYMLSNISFVSAQTSCVYVSNVNTWNSCQDGLEYADSVEYATSSSNCVDVPVVRSCSYSPNNTNSCNTMQIEDIEQNIYSIVNIEGQTWMAENLKTTTYNDGSGIGLNSNVFWYANNSANKDIYGALYKYVAANNTNICPTGWRVPTESEWNTLFENIGSTQEGHETGLIYQQNNPGTKLKISTRAGTNDYGFSALGGGKYDSDGGWAYKNINTSYWWIRNSDYNNWSGKSVNDSPSGSSMWIQWPRTLNAQMSVRCIRDIPCDDSPQPGICGTAENNYTATAPTTNLCSSGSAGSVTGNATDGYDWVCEGINANNEDDSCSSPAAQCADGIDNDNDGLIDLADLDCGGNSSNNNEGGPQGADLSCIVNPPQETYETGDSITVQAQPSGTGAGTITYSWSENVSDTGFLVGTETSQSITKSNLEPGQYSISVEGFLNGVSFGTAQCINGATNGNEIVVSNIPDIDFDIPVNIADNGFCNAIWTITTNASSTPVSCNIVTELNELVGSPITTTGNGNVNQGNEYRLECITQDEAAVEIITNQYKCLNPNLLER